MKCPLSEEAEFGSYKKGAATKGQPMHLMEQYPTLWRKAPFFNTRRSARRPQYLPWLAALSAIAKSGRLESGLLCRPPRKSSRPPESLQNAERNGAAIFAVPRLNLLCSTSSLHFAFPDRE